MKELFTWEDGYGLVIDKQQDKICFRICPDSSGGSEETVSPALLLASNSGHAEKWSDNPGAVSQSAWPYAPISTGNIGFSASQKA